MVAFWWVSRGSGGSKDKSTAELPLRMLFKALKPFVDKHFGELQRGEALGHHQGRLLGEVGGFWAAYGHVRAQNVNRG